MQLPGFIENPAPLLELLEALKDDPEEYVRRSVANNLNDIAKDHPDLVSDIANEWLKDADDNRQKLVRHACRTLIKQGHSALRKHAIKKISTQRYYPGIHSVEILANGVSAGRKDFELVMDEMPS